MMPNSDFEGQIYLSHPHTNNGFLFSSPLNAAFLFQSQFPEVSEYVEMMMSLLHNIAVT